MGHLEDHRIAHPAPTLAKLTFFLSQHNVSIFKLHNNHATFTTPFFHLPRSFIVANLRTASSAQEVHLPICIHSSCWLLAFAKRWAANANANQWVYNSCQRRKEVLMSICSFVISLFFFHEFCYLSLASIFRRRTIVPAAIWMGTFQLHLKRMFVFIRVLYKFIQRIRSHCSLGRPYLWALTLLRPNITTHFMIFVSLSACVKFSPWCTQTMLSK